MADNLLTIVQKTMGLLGLDQPTTVVGNSDVIITQMFNLANEENDELRSLMDWSVLTLEDQSIVLVADQSAYPLPADFDHLVQGTSWDTSNRWQTFGPDDAQTAQWRRQSPFADIGPRRATRQVGNTLTIYPTPTASGDIISYDYVSGYPVVSALGTLQPGFSADTDVPILPYRLYKLALRWRWRKANGFDFQDDLSVYSSQVKLAMSRDKGGGKVLSMRPGMLNGQWANADGVVAGQPTVILGTDGGDGIAVD